MDGEKTKWNTNRKKKKKKPNYISKEQQDYIKREKTNQAKFNRRILIIYPQAKKDEQTNTQFQLIGLF